MKKAQVAQLVSNAASKQHQGKFMKDMRCQAAFHETLSVQWLVKSQTEALTLAAQDDCIYTRSFKVNCMGTAGDTHCGESVETVRHILSQCRPKGFNLYMEQHDRAWLVVYYDVKIIAQRSFGTSLSPRTEILWPVVQTSSSRTRLSDTSISLRWLLPGILSRRKEEPRSSPSTRNFAQT